MTKKLYVGNLPYQTNENEIQEFFAQHGTVHSVRIITDRETGKSRGFGFVEMNEDEIDTAISSLNGVDFGGRTLKVNEARERERR